MIMSPERHERNSVEVSSFSQVPQVYNRTAQIMPAERWTPAWIAQILPPCVLLSEPKTASLGNTEDAFEYSGVINPTKCWLPNSLTQQRL